MSTQFRWFNVVFVLTLLLGFATIAGSTPRVQAAPEASDLADLEAPPAPEARSLQAPRTIAATTAYTGTAILEPDLSFDTGYGADKRVLALALQPDGKVIIGGYFQTYDGVARNFIARVNADGSLDPTFNPGSGANGQVHALALQPDGKILIGGRFAEYNGVERNLIARVNADGSLDTTFDHGDGAAGNLVTTVYALALQPDGKILIGGSFTTYDGVTRNGIARLNADGSLDLTFDPGSGVQTNSPKQVFAFALQPDGKIIAGGHFTSYDGNPAGCIVRINPDGSHDDSFFGSAGGVDRDNVLALALQPDGKIIVGGTFALYNVEHQGIMRLNPDGSLDTTFAPDGGGRVNALALQPDGKVILGGICYVVYGTCFDVVRLNPNGTFDATWTGMTNALALQPDGKIIVGGWFFRGDANVQHNNIVRLVGSSKSVTPAVNVPYHSVVTYTISLVHPFTQTNTIALTDTLPVEVDFVQWLEQPAGATFSADELHWSGEVTADETITFTFQARHVGTYSETVTNIAEWYGVLGGARKAYATFVVEPPPPLFIAKTVTPAEAAPGDALTYTLHFTNTTLATATGIVLTDTLPASIENPQVSASVPITARGGTTFVWDVADLVPDASGIITLTGQLAEATPTGPLTNTGEIAGQIDGAPRQHSSSAVLDVGGAPPASPKLAIAKTAEEYRNEPPLLVGDRILYTLRVTNTSTGTLSNLIVTDTLPAGVSFFSVPKGVPDPDQTGNPVVWQEAGLAAGETQTFKVIAKATGDPTPIGDNTATATCAEDATPRTATANLDDANVQEALTLLKDAVDLNGEPLLVDDVIRYTITVTNAHDTVTMTGVVVTDTLPAGTVFVTTTQPYTEADSTLWWQAGDLAPGESWTVEVDQRVDGSANPIAGNHAAVWCDQQDWQGTGNVYPPDPIIKTDLALGKTAEEYRNAPPLLENDRILYTIRVTNTTASALTNLVITDTLPAGVSFFSVPKGVPDPDQTGNPVVWTLDSLAADTTETFKVIVKVDGSANPIGVNQATATCAEDDLPAVASAQVPGDGTHAPGLVLSGSASGGGVPRRQTRAPAAGLDVGDLFTYTLTATNQNPTLTLHNLVVTATVPTGAEVVSATPQGTLLLPYVRWQQATLGPGASWQAVVVLRQTGAALGSMKLQAATDEQSPVEITIASPGGTRVYLPLVMRQ